MLQLLNVELIIYDFFMGVLFSFPQGSMMSSHLIVIHHNLFILYLVLIIFNLQSKLTSMKCGGVDVY